LSRNAAKGGVAAHVYETAGFYTATLTVYSEGEVIDSDSFEITVTDPDTVYAGNLTVCVSDETSNDFTGAPSGSTHIATDDLSDIAGYAGAGHRILFRRGSSWSCGDLPFANNGGPVTLGAYGSGDRPEITISSGTFCGFENKQDWRIMDLSFVDGGSGGFSGGAVSMQRMLCLRLKLDGFSVALGWSHYNDNSSIVIDHMFMVECECINNQMHAMYIGAERIALMDCILEDTDESHVCRIWQAYKGVIEHNRLSGASLVSSTNRHALKLHSPGGEEYGPLTPGTTELRYHTSFTVVSDNVFGSSGSWPVMITPQDTGSDEPILDVIFERNKFLRQFGTQSAWLTSVALHIAGDYITARNNVLDCTGGSDDIIGIGVYVYGPAGPHTGVEIYNNTVYVNGGGAGWIRTGFYVEAGNTDTIIRNNLASFIGAGTLTLVDDDGTDTVADHNLMTTTAGFIDPDNATPLSRDFGLLVTSPAIDEGSSSVAVFEDFKQRVRGPLLDLGAYEDFPGDGSTTVYVSRLIGNGDILSPTIETNAEPEYSFEFRTSVTMRF